MKPDFIDNLISVAALIFCIVFAFLVLSGCSTTSTANVKTRLNERAAKVLAVATKVNNATGVLMKTTGPLVVSTYCAVNPAACPAASQAYTLALAAQKQYTAALTDMTAANAAPDGLKLATLAANFQVRFGELNTLLTTAGVASTDVTTLTEFQKNVATLKALSAETTSETTKP